MKSIFKSYEKEKNMADSDKTVDVYYDMEIAQICEHFSKSRNTVDKAVAKLVKDYPDAGYKYKNPETRRITIKAEGVEKLSKYFRKEKHEVSSVETELRFENEKLKAILDEKQQAMDRIESLYQERLALELEKSRQTFLIENQSKEDRIKELEDENTMLQHKSEKLDFVTNTLQNKNQELENMKTDMNSVQEELQELKRKEEEYNSKSFFYRLTHKF